MRTVALIVAILLGLAAAVGVHSHLSRSKQALQQKNRPVEVATAARTIETGDVLEAEMVSWTRTKPADMLSAQDVTRSNVNDYIGRELRRPVDRDRQIFAGHFIKREERGGSRILAEGKTAVTIGVDATSGVAGLIRPGDHIDLYATTVRKGVPETLLVLSDVTVLAVDNRVSEAPEGLAGYSRARRGYSSLTLMVSPQSAQVLIYLKDNARLACTLRSVEDMGRPLADMPSVTEANVRSLIDGLRDTERAPTPAP